MTHAFFWVFLLACVIAGCVHDLIKTRYKSDQQQKLLDESSREILERLKSIETRLANLETIVLDREKEQAFERQL